MFYYLFSGLILGFMIPLIASRIGKLIPSDPGFILLHLPHKVRFPKVYDPARLYQWHQKWKLLLSRCIMMSVVTGIIFTVSDFFLPIEILGFACTFLYILLILIVIDAEYCLLPDFFTIPLFLIGLFFAIYNPAIGIENAAIGGTIGYLMSVLSVMLMAKSKSNQLGGGDVKLITASGIWFGPLGLSICLIMSFFLFIICSVLSKQKKGAYGPAFGIAAILTFFLLYTK